MANYLSKKEQAYYNKHTKRRNDRKATPGERKYSGAWLDGFDDKWSKGGYSSAEQVSG